jgi:hypothetical protein
MPLTVHKRVLFATPVYVMYAWVGSSHSITKPRARATPTASAASAVISTTCGRLSGENAILKRLAQDREDMPPELRPFIQAAHAVVRPRHLARRGDVPAADHSDSRNLMMWGTTRAGCNLMLCRRQ